MFLALSVGLLAAYFINLFIGMQTGTFFIQDVGEVVLLFASAAAFVTTIVRREAKAKSSGK